MKLNIKSIRLNNEFFQAIVRSVIKNKVVKETSWSLLARIIAITLIFTTNIILARFLGPDKFGIYNVFLSIINVVLVIVTLGLDFSASRMIAKYSNKLKLIRYVISVVARCQIISLIIFLTAFYFLIGSVSNFYGIEELGILLKIGIIFIFFKSLLSLIRVFYQGFHRLKYLALLSFLEHFLILLSVIIIILCVENYRIANIIQGLSVGIFVAFILALAIFIKYLKQKKQSCNKLANSESYDKKKVREELFSYAKPLYLTCLMTIIAGEIDVLMLAKYVDSAEIAFYAIPKQIILYSPIFSASVGLGIAPLYSKLNKDNCVELKRIFYKSIKSVFVMYLLPLLLLIVFFKQFIILFYSDEYLKAAEIFYYLTPYLFYAIFLGVTGQVLDYLGLAKKRAAVLTICVLLNFSLNLILIPIYQTIGAAISFSVSYLPYFLGSFYFISKRFQSISENKRKIINK